MRSLIDIMELSTAEIDELIDVAQDIIANPEKYSEKCKGKKLATLFFEPSTRTRLSFEAAMFSDFPRRRAARQQRAKVFPILFAP